MPQHAWVAPLAAACITLSLAVLVVRKGQRTELTHAFVLLATVLVFWNLNFFVLYSVTDHDIAFALTRVTRCVIPFLPPAILHLMLAVRSTVARRWRYALGADYAFSAVMAILNADDRLVSDIRPGMWGWVAVGTPLYSLFILSNLLNLPLAVAVLIRAYRASADPKVRTRIRFWLVGALVAVPLGFPNLLLPYGVRAYPLGSLGTALWAGVVAYAIVRHRIMDIDVVITKGVAYAAVAIVLIVPAFGLALWFQQVSFGQIHVDFSFAILLMLVAVGVLFPVLRLRAESRLEQSLFRAKYEDRAMLIKFSSSLVRILDRNRLVGDLAATLLETLKLDRVAIAFGKPTGQTFAIIHAVGTPPVDEHFSAADGFITALRRRQQAALREELEAVASPEERASVRDVCTRNGWQVCIPLEGGDTLIGFVALGAKRTRDTFFSSELQILDVLGAQASIALENARLYEELKRSQEIIRRADRLSALGTLAAGIAHEIRNPLVSIQTFFQLAPDRLHDEEFLTTFLNLTSSEVKRISNLIAELLSFARSPTPTFGPVDLAELATRVVALLAAEARKHQLDLTCTAEPDLRPVHADTDQMKQVLINLVLNAIQATPPGGSVTVVCRPVVVRGEPCGQVEVRDTGAGIPRELIDSVFNPFFTTKDKGTGLGLTIAHQILSEHGGQITVESAVGTGTSFVVSLPISDHGAGEPELLRQPDRALPRAAP